MSKKKNHEIRYLKMQMKIKVNTILKQDGVDMIYFCKKTVFPNRTDMGTSSIIKRR